jgi:phospholipase C
MPKGLENLKHIVVLMMENRSFDHMLGSLKAVDARINGLTGTETNPDTTNEPAKVLPNAAFQGQLDPDPDHHFPAVNKQLFFGTQGPPGAPSMQGFVQSYFDQKGDVGHSRKIMYYFKPQQLPVLTSLARSFALFNGWFASIPGPTICNRAFAHYGTSFGSVSMDPFVVKPPYLSIYDRMLAAGRTAKLYYFDIASSTMEVVNLLSNQPQIFATYDQLLNDIESAQLPDYSFIEPNYSDHAGPDGGELMASDQHPDHDVQSGEIFIASIYDRIVQNDNLRDNTALLIVYDEHGGIYDHVPPPSCTPDLGPDGKPFVASAEATGTGQPFAFDRLGVRVPAVLVSPWIAKATVVPGSEDLVNGRVFEHASIPATVTKFFIGDYANRSPREKAASTFLDLLGDQARPPADLPFFNES